MRYFAVTTLGAGGAYGTADSSEEAARICLKEARGFAAAFGGFRSDATIRIAVYPHAADEYVSTNDGGTFLHDRESDEVKGLARLSHLYEGNPTKTIAKGFRLLDVSEWNDKIDAANAKRA